MFGIVNRVIAFLFMPILRWIVGETIPHIIIRAFTDDASIIKDVAYVLRIVIAIVPLLGIQLFGVWLAFPIADILAAIITAYVLKKEMYKISLESNKEE